MNTSSSSSTRCAPSRRRSASPRSMPGRRPRRAFGVRAALYYLLCWSVIGILVPVSIGGWWLVLALAVVTTAPLIAFISQGGWREYPTAAFRLLVVRPVLYTQLLLPLVAGGGLL